MSKYTTEAIRSVALIGHGAAGKTSLAEALLQATGAIPARGSVEKGSTVCDFDLQEMHINLISLSGNVVEDDDTLTLSWNS